MAIATIYALFGDEIRVAAVEPSGDIVFEVLSSIVFFFFLLEIILNAIAKPEYISLPTACTGGRKTPSGWTFGSFSFWLDVIATVSLIDEIPWLLSTSTNGRTDTSIQSARGARAGRLVRLARLVRFARLARLYRYYFMARGARSSASQAQKATLQTQVGLRLTELTTRRIIVGILAMMAVIPQLQPLDKDNTPRLATDFLHSASLRSDGPPAGSAEVLSVVDTMVDSRTAQASVVFISTNGSVLLDTGTWSSLRNTELLTEERTSGGVATTVRFSRRDQERESALWSLALTASVMILLVGAVAMFTYDISHIVLQPIESMIGIVKAMATDPLAVPAGSAPPLCLAPGDSANSTGRRPALRRSGSSFRMLPSSGGVGTGGPTSGRSPDGTGSNDAASAVGSMPGQPSSVELVRTKPPRPEDWKVDPAANFGSLDSPGELPPPIGTFDAELETTLLLRTLHRFPDLLRLGVGEAGAAMIAGQLARNQGSFDPALPGQVTRAILGTVRVPALRIASECLQAEVAPLTARVFAVLHTIIRAHGGIVLENTSTGVVVAWPLRALGAAHNAATGRRSSASSRSSSSRRTSDMDTSAKAYTGPSNADIKRAGVLGQTLLSARQAQSGRERSPAVSTDDGSTSESTTDDESGDTSHQEAKVHDQTPAHPAASTMAGLSRRRLATTADFDALASGGGGNSTGPHARVYGQYWPSLQEKAFGSHMSLDLASRPTDAERSAMVARADHACMAMVKVAMELAADETVSLCSPRAARFLRAAAPRFRLRAHCALHAGWVMTAVIGSERKVDARFVSPHVAITNALAESCAAYGTSVLLSDAMAELLPPHTRSLCRTIDRVAPVHVEDAPFPHLPGEAVRRRGRSNTAKTARRKLASALGKIGVANAFRHATGNKSEGPRTPRDSWGVSRRDNTAAVAGGRPAAAAVRGAPTQDAKTSVASRPLLSVRDTRLESSTLTPPSPTVHRRPSAAAAAASGQPHIAVTPTPKAAGLRSLPSSKWKNATADGALVAATGGSDSHADDLSSGSPVAESKMEAVAAPGTETVLSGPAAMPSQNGSLDEIVGSLLVRAHASHPPMEEQKQASRAGPEAEAHGIAARAMWRPPPAEVTVPVPLAASKPMTILSLDVDESALADVNDFAVSARKHRLGIEALSAALSAARARRHDRRASQVSSSSEAAGFATTSESPRRSPVAAQRNPSSLARLGSSNSARPMTGGSVLVPGRHATLHRGGTTSPSRGPVVTVPTSGRVSGAQTRWPGLPSRIGSEGANPDRPSSPLRRLADGNRWLDDAAFEVVRELIACDDAAKGWPRQLIQLLAEQAVSSRPGSVLLDGVLAREDGEGDPASPRGLATRSQSGLRSTMTPLNPARQNEDDSDADTDDSDSDSDPAAPDSSPATAVGGGRAPTRSRIAATVRRLVRASPGLWYWHDPPVTARRTMADWDDLVRAHLAMSGGPPPRALSQSSALRLMTRARTILAVFRLPRVLRRLAAIAQASPRKPAPVPRSPALRGGSMPPLRVEATRPFPQTPGVSPVSLQHPAPAGEAHGDAEAGATLVARKVGASPGGLRDAAWSHRPGTGVRAERSLFVLLPPYHAKHNPWEWDFALVAATGGREAKKRRDRFEAAFSAYQQGRWVLTAKRLLRANGVRGWERVPADQEASSLRDALSRLVDGPSVALAEVLLAHELSPPPNWPGFRPLVVA